MRFHQPVGVLPQSNDFMNVGINVNSQESRFLIGNKTNNQLTHINANNFTNVTSNLTQILIDKQSESINNFDSGLDSNKTISFENVLKFKKDSEYFKNFSESPQKTTSSIDLENGNNDEFVFIQTLNFVDDNLSQVRWSFEKLLQI